MQSKQIGRRLRRLAEAGVTAGPVLVALLEKGYPKYGPLGRQALEMVVAFREEGRRNMYSLPTGGANYPSSPLIRGDYPPRQQADPVVWKDALGSILGEIQESEELLRAEGTDSSVSKAPR